MDSYQERVKNLISASGKLHRYLTALPVDSWSKPSTCAQWQIADIVGHLVLGAEGYTDNVSRGLQGDPSPPEGRGPAGSDAAVSSAERIAAGAIAARERLGDQLLATYESTGSRLHQLLAGLSPQDRQKPCYHGGGIVPAENFVDLRLNELTLHDWDIRASLEPNARLAPEGLPSTLLMFTRSLAAGSVRWAFWPGPKLSSPVRYRFVVTEPIPLTVDISVAGDRVRLEEPGQQAADTTFNCDTETFVLLMYGRISTSDAAADGRLSVEGDSELTARFNQWFRGI